MTPTATDSLTVNATVHVTHLVPVSVPLPNSMTVDEINADAIVGGAVRKPLMRALHTGMRDAAQSKMREEVTAPFFHGMLVRSLAAQTTPAGQTSVTALIERTHTETLTVPLPDGVRAGEVNADSVPDALSDALYDEAVKVETDRARDTGADTCSVGVSIRSASVR